MARRKEVKKMEKQKALILQVAQNIITKEGENKLTMRNIAKEIGFSLPIIYRHFENKEDIIQALALQGCSTLVTSLQEAAQSSSNSEHKLENVARTYLEFARTHPALYNIILREHLNRSRYHQNPITELRVFFGSLWQNTKKMESKVDFMFASLQGIVSVMYQKGRDITQKEIDELLTLFTKGLSLNN